MAVELIEGLHPSRAINEFRQRLLEILDHRMPMTTRQIEEEYKAKYGDRDRSFASIYQQLRTMATHGTVVWNSWDSQLKDGQRSISVTFARPLDTPSSLDPEDVESWLSQ